MLNGTEWYYLYCNESFNLYIYSVCVCVCAFKFRCSGVRVHGNAVAPLSNFVEWDPLSFVSFHSTEINRTELNRTKRYKYYTRPFNAKCWVCHNCYKYTCAINRPSAWVSLLRHTHNSMSILDENSVRTIYNAPNHLHLHEVASHHRRTMLQT